MLKITRFILPTIIVASCSIIGDDDITDPDSEARFLSISISGEGQEGFSALGTAQFQSDSENRIASINWSGLKTDGEFRFRSGDLMPADPMQSTGFLTETSNATVMTMIDGYDSNGNITAIRNSAGSSVFETYEFEYDNQNRLIAITTIYGDPASPCLVNLTDCGGSAIKLRDTISGMVESGKISGRL